MATLSPRVLVTRAAEDAPALAHALAMQGLAPVVVPLIRRIWEVDPLAELARAVPVADWVLLTSAAVMDAVALAAPGAWRGARWAAVGAVTARRADALGYPVAVTTAGVGVDLSAALGELRGATIVLPRGDLAGEDLPAALRARGASVHEALAYRNLEPTDAAARLRSALPVDFVALMSGSAATRLAALVADPGALGQIVASGPSTADAARRAGLTVAGVATVHSADGIAALIAALHQS